MSAQILQFWPMSEAPNRIREFRLRAGLSQQAVADRIGVSKMTVSDLERGLIELNLNHMRRIAAVFEVRPADLLLDTDNPEGLAPSERDLIERLRAATDDQRTTLLRVSEAILPGGDQHKEVA